MARDIQSKDKFEFNDIYRKYTGEYLEELLKGLYLFMPKILLFFSILFVITSIFGFNNGSLYFFLTSLTFLILTAMFSYMMFNERANIPLIGVINDARSTQLNIMLILV